jgi:hypothetical protein
MKPKPDPATYPLYYKFQQLRNCAIKEALGQRSKLLKLKHKDNVENLEEIQRFLDQNHSILLKYGVNLDRTWEMPVISEYFPITE